MNPPIERACFWLAQRPPTPHTVLTGHHDAEVVVVGAGLTGLWTALFLRELRPQLDVAVIEQGGAAYGASGRNAGMVAETIDHTHGLAIQHFGEDEARQLAQLGRENLEEMFAYLRRHGVDCDFEPSGRMLVALTPGHLAALRENLDDAARVGVTDYRLLDREETQAELRSPLYQGGLLIPAGGVLDPVKLVDGLRRIALAQGIRIYEHSKVERLADEGSHVRVVSPEGSLRAPHVVLAASAYTHHLVPQVARRFIPLYDYIVVSDPLSSAQLDAIGWHRRMGVTDMRNFFLYYRLTRDQRIVWGTSEAVYYRGNRVDAAADHSAPHYAALRTSFAQHFPPLAGLEFPYAWGGPICATTRLTPFFGAALGGKVRYGLGFTGHGLGSTRLAGRILAHLALAQPHAHLALTLARKPPLPYPPEPLRGFAVSLVANALRKVDQGESPGLLLRTLTKLGIGFSS